MTNIYEILTQSIPKTIYVKKQLTVGAWIITELSDGSLGCCSRVTEEKSSLSLENVCAFDASQYLLSDSLSETVCGLSVINAYYNKPERLKNLQCETEINAFCTDGINIEGKKIGMLGHMGRTAEHIQKQSELFIFEFNPKPGDYPAEAEKDILPQCDIVIMSGTTISNHTLIDVLQMSPEAKHILLGPSVPMCENIKGIDRLSGNIITEKNQFLAQIGSYKKFPVSLAKSYNLDL